MIYKILTLILAVLLCLSILFSKELSIEKALKERENEAIRKEIKAKDFQILASHERERAKEAIYLTFKARYDSAVKSSTLGWKLYTNEKKHRRTPILADSVYTSVIDSLFSGR